MMKLVRSFLFVFCLLWTSLLPAVEEPGNNAPSAVNEARRAAWELAGNIVETIDRTDQSDSPGIKAWLGEYRKVARDSSGKPLPKAWNGVEAESLVTRNPSFWQTYYEIAPSDPGLSLLHSALLLSAGEASRASYVAIITAQRPGGQKPLEEGFGYVLGNAARLREQSDALVTAGIKLHDQGDYGGALKKYREALALWPQNGWAHFETGFTLMTQELIQAGKVVPKGEAVIVNDRVEFSPDVVSAYAMARRYDPFQLKAYQGGDKQVLQSLLALAQKGMPQWQKITQSRQKPVADQTLEELGNAFQEASIHDLALVTRQVLVARRGSYSPSDFPFISTSLRKLVPGTQTEETLKRLSGKEPMKVRTLVKQKPAYVVARPSPGRADEKKDAVFQIDSLIVYQDLELSGKRLQGQLGPFSEYCKAVANTAHDFWQSLPKGEGQTLLLIIYLKPEQKARYWLTFRDKAISAESLEQLQKRLAGVQPFKIQNGQVVVAWKIDLWGGLPQAESKKDVPAPEDILFPKEWQEAAQAKNLTLKLPLSDATLQSIWPDK
jgi:hypothetical protein